MVHDSATEQAATDARILSQFSKLNACLASLSKSFDLRRDDFTGRPIKAIAIEAFTRAFAPDQLVIRLHILFGHPFGRKSAFKCRTDTAAVELAEPFDRLYSFLLVLDDASRHSILNNLRD